MTTWIDRRATRAIVALVATSFLLVTACENLTRSRPELATGSQRVIPVQGEAPFYYAGREKIILGVDTSELVISYSNSAAETRVRAIFTAASIRLVRDQVLGAEADHHVLTVGGASSSALQTAITQLRIDTLVDFVAPSYRILASNTHIQLVNNIDVQFRSGVSRAQIDSVMRATGLRLLRVPFPDSGYFAYRFKYPRGRDVDPLKVAASVHDSPLVQWSSPGIIDDVRPASGPNDPCYSQQSYLKSCFRLRKRYTG